VSALIRVNDVGTIFRFTLSDSNANPVDLATASLIEVVLLPPDGVIKTRTASVYGTPTNGVAQYLTIAGDINQIGKWKSQVVVTFPTTHFSSTITSFTVYENLA